MVALALRLYGIDWDQGHGYHPDERSIYMRSDCMYRVLAEAPGYDQCVREHPDMEAGLPGLDAFLDADRSPFNPHWFPLGSILIYLIVGVRFLLEPFMDASSLLTMSYAGRSIMALADVGTVFMVYLLGKRMYDRRAGLLAASLVALAVVHIQHSHFYRPEPLLVFFLMASFWFMLQVMERRRLRDSLLLGLFVGLTLAPKVSVLPLALPLVLTYGSRLFIAADGRCDSRWGVPSYREASATLKHIVMGAAVAVVVFAVTTPYAVLDLAEFIDQNAWQAGMARTAGTVPFTVQYIDSTPFLYELKQTSLWALGLPLGIVAWGGLVFTILKVTRGSPARRAELLFLAWVVPNFLMLGIFEVKFLRYIFPILPFLVVMGSGMLIWMLDRARSSRSRASPLTSSPLAGDGIGRVRGLLASYAPHALIGVIVFVVAATAFYALSFERVYTRPHTAIQASRWINENVPVNSTIITDNHWDEGIRDIYRYKVRQIRIYESDTLAKIETIARDLSQGDYLVFYSNRTYGSVARLPERYPLSSHYYQMLFSEKLGYRLEKAFTSYPQLLGVAFLDDTFTRAGVPEPEALRDFKPAPVSLNLGYADENVMDYDHPKVLIFKNVEGLSHSELNGLLTRGLPAETPELGLMMDSERKADQRQGGTWSEVIKRDSWTNSVPVLAWLLVVELVYLAALPLATFLFRPLPDRGIVLARILGMLGVAYVAWLLASLGWVGFSRTSVLVGILLVAFLSALVLAARWREFKEFVKSNWRLIAIGEAVFLAAFLAFVAIRVANPDLWHPYRGGEKPMDFAYLNAVLRSTYMPPYDPWFAGGYLNYYYWGQFLVATPIKAMGIIPSVAYNLAVPFLFALTVTGAYSLVYNLTAGVRRLAPTPRPDPAEPSVETGAEVFSRPPPQDSAPRRPGGLSVFGGWRRWGHGIYWGPVIAGLVAGLFVAVMGNLDGIVQLVQGAWNSTVGGSAFPAFDFWRSSRMLPISNDVIPSALTFWLPDKAHPDPELGHHITEFPFFTFLFADLHAHLIAIPFTLLAIGLGLSLLVGLRGLINRWWLVLVTTALAVAVGSLWAINSWDYPTYLLLAVLLIGVGAYLVNGKPLKRVGLFVALAGSMVALSFLAFLPFHASYHPFPTGIDVSKWQTPIQNYLGIHGLFLFLVLTFLLYLARGRLRGLAGFLARPTLGDAQDRSGFPDMLTWVVGGLGVLIAAYLAAAGYWTSAVLVLVLLTALWAVKGVLVSREESAPYTVVPLVFIVLALLISIGVEFVRVEDYIGRMNTLFKYYIAVWVLFAMSSAYILWYLASRGVFAISIRPDFSRMPGSLLRFRWLRGASLARGVWLALLALLLASSFIYTILGTRDRLADRFDTRRMTLDGADYMRTAVYTREGPTIEFRWDEGAIRWLQDNVEGSPVVLEAHNDQYTWSSRIADYTGLPTVLGWPWHQIQQRMKYDYAVRGRSSVVREMYSTLDMERTLELLRLYEVEYVVVGQLERAYYPGHGLRKFDTMVDRGLARVAYRNEGVKIYQGLWYN